MKHAHQHESGQNASPLRVPVRFELKHPTAINVSVAGTFNDWCPESKNLHSTGDGRWLKETVLAPGSYEYRFIVDGQWMADPMVSETVPNPFGGRNTVLNVVKPTDARHLADAENLPLVNAHKQKAQ